MRRFLPSLALIVMLLIGGFALGSSQPRSDDSRLRLLDEALSKVRSMYVEDLPDSVLVGRALNGFLGELDPYSQFLDRAEFTNLRIGTSGSYHGLGIVISLRDGFLTVISPMEGTPAYRMGIMAGDRIIEIDGQTTEGMSLNDAVDKMRGPKGTTVELTIARGRDFRRLEFELVRDKIELKSVPYSFVDEQQIGYIRISQFAEETTHDLEQALARVEKEGARGLILDLRANPGGLLTQAVEVSEHFVGGGKLVVETRGRQKNQNRGYTSRARSVYSATPVIVLVNGGSASASEIVAGAIQDWDLGLIVGTTTFGKGSVQTVVDLSDGSAIKLTTAKYYTPSGRCIHKEERRPDPTVTAAVDPEGKAHHRDERETYRTAMGREVFGGGGIAPDVVVEVDELPAVIEDIERLGLFYEFTTDFLKTHPDWKAEQRPGDRELAEFTAFLAPHETEDIKFAADDLAAARPQIERGIRREVARRLDSDQAAWRVMLEGDSQYAEARKLFAESPTLAGLFQIADARRERTSAP
jgi:carboxyl-terminal processing protease